jgi:Zinc carboxypeptidase
VKKVLTLVTLFLSLLSFDSRAFAEDPHSVLPQVTRIADVKSPEQYFGFPIGSRHLRHDQVVSYLRYLDESSDRVQLVPYGSSHGGRPLLTCAISSIDNIKNLENISSTRPDLASGNFKGDLANQPLVMSLGYCVHGDEASAMNAAPLVAYHLATATDEQTIGFLENSIAMIDPALNPDGVDRFANWANENRGRFASPSPIDREHNQQWPGGRTNYYFFDLNRDWLPAVHPESQGRIKLFHKWKPNVVLDFHEMGGNSSFFFQPGELKSINPFSPKENLRITRLFAKEHIAAMDNADELFYSEENFDDFYIGKGSTYPDIQGAIGILFEQASSRGLNWANKRISRTFADTVANQVRMSLSSIRAASQQRESILKLQVSFFENALETAKSHPIKGYVLSGTPSRLVEATKLLELHTVQVFSPEPDFQLSGKTFSQANSIVIPLNQPQHFFIRALMEPKQSFERNVFYDVSTWHFPSAFDLHVDEINSDIPSHWTHSRARHYHENGPPSSMVDSDAEKVIGWAIPPGELQTPRVVAALQQLDTQFRVTTLPAKLWIANKIPGEPAVEISLPQGTFAVLKQPNRANWPQISAKLIDLCSLESVEVHPIYSGSTSDSPDWGSDTLFEIPKCNPLLVMGSGTTSYSAGSLWYFVDQRLQQPLDTVDVDRLSSVELDEYSCVLLPEGSYGTLTDSAVQALQDYVQDGGTVIAIGSAISMLQKKKLLKGVDSSSDSGDVSPSNINRRFADADDEAALETIAGAFFEVSIDDTHPLAFGFPDSKIPVFRTTTRRYSIPSDSYQLIAKYEDVIAGYVSQRNRNSLNGSAAAWVTPSGSGKFILLADNPVFRGYVRGAERFLVNAMYLGPAFKLPSGSGSDGDDDHEH